MVSPHATSTVAAHSRSFIANGNDALENAVRGCLFMHPGLSFNEKQRVIYKKMVPGAEKVTLLSGGGSGHEPAHVGYVGSAMLDAAVCGNIFASPNAKQIETGLELVRSTKGTLVIVKNYTGDKLNFTLAAERFRYATGAHIRLVVVTDDVSIGRTKSARVGRRGLAGTVLVHKIAGGAAAAGWSLDNVADVAQFAIDNMGTIGVALDGCDVPGQAQTHQPRLAPDEIELGIGIHNEPGSKRISPKPALGALVADMLAAILDEADEERNYLANRPRQGQSDVVVLVNNLGGLSALEIAGITGEICSHLSNKYQMPACRVYAGTFLSALNGPGFSITILNLPKNERLSSNILEFLDLHTDAFGWPASIPTSTWDSRATLVGTDPVTPPLSPDIKNASSVQTPEILCNPVLFKSIITSIHASLVAAEPEITRLDLIMGDGDCGTTLLAGSSGIVEAIESERISTSDLAQSVMTIADVVSQCMGGTSGALYGVFFTAFASAICNIFKLRGRADFACIADALQAALSSLKQVTAAREGDRTMMDALIPFVDTLAARKGEGAALSLDHAVLAAKDGCEITRNMESKFGRSTYVSAEDSEAGTSGLADPGACGVVAIAEGLQEALKRVNL